jgi:hypothetical protein
MHAVEIETFLVSRDSRYSDKWNIRNMEISEPWKAVLGDNWDITMSGDPIFQPLYKALQAHWDAASQETGLDVLICEVLVEYTFTAPPGITSLRYGRHVWADTDQFWFLRGDHKYQWKVIGGFVRTVNMVSILEGSHVERRNRSEEERRRAEERAVFSPREIGTQESRGPQARNSRYFL